MSSLYSRRVLFFIWRGVLLSMLIFTGCRSVQVDSKLARQLARPFPGYESLSQQEQMMADTLLRYALDHEALYSLLGDIKPVSNVFYVLANPIGKDTTMSDGDAEVVKIGVDSIQRTLRTLEAWNNVTDALSFGDYQFLIVPFRQVRDGQRNFQLVVCRTDLIDSLLLLHAPFFAQWGFVPGTNPGVLLTTTEFEYKNDRYRAYGYLFGYPRHAVDFFVSASQEEEKTDQFVERNFFQIPVFAKNSGYFTYAVPDDYQPDGRDSTIYYRAVEVLEDYKALRPDYINKDGQLDAVSLLRDYWRKYKLR